MQMKELYQNRLNQFKLKTARLQKKEEILSLARLVSFAGGIVLFIFLLSVQHTAAFAALVICLIAFGLLVRQYAKTEKMKHYYQHLSTINELEFKCIHGDFSGFADGHSYIDKNHPNSYDLDLFGQSSLFQYINRTTSRPAADMLAGWLNSPAPQHEIVLRQQAVRELQPMIEWRQNLNTLGYFNKNAGDSPAALETWIKGESYFQSRMYIKYIITVLSAMGVSVTAAIAVFGLSWVILLPLLVLNFVFYFSNGKKITKLHQQVSRSSEMLQSYSEAISLIESQEFAGEKLKQIRAIFTRGIHVSKQIKNLSALVGRLDTRLNIMVSIPLNLFFFWDIHCCLALEKWKNNHAPHLKDWLIAMAELEVLSSISNMAFNNPEWTMPRIVPEYFVLNAENMGHPLIPKHRRIINNFVLSASSFTMIVTGSNMSGKSTFLRTCGVNAIMALAGAPVCATSFILSHIQVLSSMRISDSLEDNTSSFYAELQRLAKIIKEAEHNQKVFLLLDEILRGTNSNDRFTGSVALIRQLLSCGTVSVVATHDLRLADLASELPDMIGNYHFDVRIDGEEMYFDYKLTPGICKSMNASLLMKKMGIKIGITP
jgi:DNA mismatch repair ATPase MutS